MAVSASTTNTIQRAMSVGGVGFGLGALLAPDAFGRLYGTPESGPDLRFATRLWGTRTATFSLLLLPAMTATEKRRILGPATAMNAVDVVVALTNTDIPRRTRYLAAATSAAFAGLGAFLLAND